MNLSEIKDYARKNSVPIMFDETQEFICNYIKHNNVKYVLEVGTAIGYSAIQFALAKDDVKVVTIEIDIDRFILARENVEKNGLSDRISLNHCDALEFSTDQKFDLIFIDAAKAQYVKFFEKFKNNLTSDGTIISDNLFFHGMVENPALTHNYSTIKLVRKIRKYVSFLKSNPEFKTDFFSLGDGISTSKFNTKYKKLDSDIIETEVPGTMELTLDKIPAAQFQFRKDCLYIKKIFLNNSQEIKEVLRHLKIISEKKDCHSIQTAAFENFRESGFFPLENDLIEIRF